MEVDKVSTAKERNLVRALLIRSLVFITIPGTSNEFSPLFIDICQSFLTQQ